MTLGRRGEDLTCAYYQKSGYRLLDRNYIYRVGRQTGEIDLIFVRARELVFVEVKTRRSGKFGSAVEAVDINKQRKLVKTTKLYLQQHPAYANYAYRIDVATVDIDNLHQPVIIIPNAIEDLD